MKRLTIQPSSYGISQRFFLHLSLLLSNILLASAALPACSASDNSTGDISPSPFYTGLIILVLAALFFFSKRILRYIQSLKKDRQQAVEQLSMMSQKNQALKYELQKTKDELEIRVEKRTAALKKEVESRLMAETKYRKIMDASPVPIVVFDMDGKPIFINTAFTRTFGWTLEEFQNEKTKYIPDEEQELNLQIRRKIVKGLSGHGVETRRYNRKGELLDVNISFDVWRGKDNRPIGCVVILHDVTQSKQLEKQLFLAQKMEAMGTLAAGIAHDFNNILSGIFAFSQMANKHARDTDKVKEHIGQIEKGAQRASSLVQQILTYCRRKEYQKEQLNLGVILKETLDLLSSTLPPQIQTDIEIEKDITVMADPTQIHRVIMNLCTNALHAMPDTSGKLSITLRKNLVSKTDIEPDLNIIPGEYALLEISDTGHGMDKETMDRAFDPYFTTKENGKGTGFGLALAKAIVESHDGYITARSTPGKGARFRIYLPLSNVPLSSDPVASEAPDIIGGTERIMIVDDEESIRMAVSESLEDYGYKVSAFSDGMQALDAFKQDPDTFDLVLTDMTMPKMNGDKLAMEIMNIRKDIPIILSTGYNENRTEEQAIKSGIKFYIPKPFSNQKLESLIRKALD